MSEFINKEFDEAGRLIRATLLGVFEKLIEYHEDGSRVERYRHANGDESWFEFDSKYTTIIKSCIKRVDGTKSWRLRRVDGAPIKEYVKRADGVRVLTIYNEDGSRTSYCKWPNGTKNIITTANTGSTLVTP